MKDYLIIDNKKYKILHFFNYNNDNFIIYTDDSINDEILANKYIIHDNKISLLPINDNEWEIVDKEWEKINE